MNDMLASIAFPIGIETFKRGHGGRDPTAQEPIVLSVPLAMAVAIAMREPTPEMIAAGNAAAGGELALRVWRAMIDEILKA